jgi:hypothetical protein
MWRLCFLSSVSYNRNRVSLLQKGALSALKGMTAVSLQERENTEKGRCLKTVEREKRRLFATQREMNSMPSFG